MEPEARSFFCRSVIIPRISSHSAGRSGMLWMSERLAVDQSFLMYLFQRFSLSGPPR